MVRGTCTKMDLRSYFRSHKIYFSDKRTRPLSIVIVNGTKSIVKTCYKEVVKLTDYIPWVESYSKASPNAGVQHYINLCQELQKKGLVVSDQVVCGPSYFGMNGPFSQTVLSNKGSGYVSIIINISLALFNYHWAKHADFIIYCYGPNKTYIREPHQGIMTQLCTFPTIKEAAVVKIQRAWRARCARSARGSRISLYLQHISMQLHNTQW